MNYQKVYNSLIQKRRENPPPSGEYCEAHHIIPKSLGGNNSKSNLVRLTAREHLIAHALLLKSYMASNDVEAVKSLQGALFAMGARLSDRGYSKQYALSRVKQFGCYTNETARISKFLGVHGRTITESTVNTKVFYWSSLQELVIKWFETNCIDVEMVERMLAYFRLMAMEFSCGLKGFLERNDGKNESIYRMFGAFA